MITLYGKTIRCENCKSENISHSGIEKIGDRGFTTIQCEDCKHLYYFSYSVREEVNNWYRRREHDSRHH